MDPLSSAALSAFMSQGQLALVWAIEEMAFQAGHYTFMLGTRLLFLCGVHIVPITSRARIYFDPHIMSSYQDRAVGVSAQGALGKSASSYPDEGKTL
ncbi:hypothetical protein N7478_010096 [Penicillium angulare]|uniref:uncharacterized protein n=1 Tax=Penicillium angulare TaxID=116970 RepID=UPI002541AAC3|nr:uncharacterized protein N7478_010096 [Penicillium angulare]KAJ5267288.1 hypothetical protein N7478_010096 [Penicillium angulare]